MTRYPEANLGDLIEIFDSRRVPLSSIERAKRPGPFPYYGAAQIFDSIDDFLFDGTFLLVGEDGSVVRENGRPFVQVARGRFWANNHTHVLRPVDGVDFWYLQTAVEFADISGHITGAAQPKLNQANLRRISLPFPPEPIRNLIGGIASAFFELIGNNSRRIEILEEMAQAIYREWFVEFRYPGHEDVPLVDSELGPIPEGWAVRELREVVRVNEHSLKAGAEIGEIQYVDIASVDVGRISKTQTIEYSEAPGRARRKGQHGDIIWSTVRPNRRAYAQLIDPPTNLVMSTGFAVISPVRLPSSLLKQMLSTDAFVGYLSSRATGATYPAVTPSDFEEARFVVADEATNSKFNELAEPIDTLIAFLKSEIEILSETRDLLLPKLISGEIDVSELDFELADSLL